MIRIPKEIHQNEWNSVSIKLKNSEGKNQNSTPVFSLKKFKNFYFISFLISHS
jgi:hypothetical protein